MVKDYPTGEELDMMTEKEEWEIQKIVNRLKRNNVPVRWENSYNFLMKEANEKLAIERAKVKEHGLCNKKECKYYNGVQHYKAQVEKLKGENLRLRNARNRLIGIDDAPEGGGEERYCTCPQTPNPHTLSAPVSGVTCGLCGKEIMSPQEDPEGG